MLRFLAIRLAQSVPVLIVMSIITFIIIQAPPGDYGDFIRTNMITQGNATMAAADAAADVEDGVAGAEGERVDKRGRRRGTAGRDKARAKHFFVAQDTGRVVLLVVQEVAHGRGVGLGVERVGSGGAVAAPPPSLPRPFHTSSATTLRHFQQSWFWLALSLTYASTQRHPTSSQRAWRPPATTARAPSNMSKYDRGSR